MTLHATLEHKTLKNNLPFSIGEQSISTWLKSLQTNDDIGTLQVLTHTLESLKKTTIPVKTRAFFLEKISVLVFRITKELQKNYLKSYFPFSNSERLKLKLAADCALGIADNYALICEDPCFKTKSPFSFQQKAFILVDAVQALANVLLYKAILYEKPGEGFWTLCYLFYLIAKQNRALTLTPNKKTTSFIKIFKCLFVFELSHTQQFNTEEIHIVFSLLLNMSKHVDLLPLVPENKMDKTPCIDLRADTPPSASHLSISKKSPHIFYVSSHNLINQLFELFSHKKNISYPNRLIVLRLIKTLSKNHKRKENRVYADSELFADIGFDMYSESLLHKEAVSSGSRFISSKFLNLGLDSQLEQQYKNSLSGRKNMQQSALSLAWRAEDNTIDFIENTDIWSAKKVNAKKESSETNAILIDQGDFGFCIGLKGDHSITKVGEIIHLQRPDSSIVTVVRRIIPSSNKNYDVIVGVEILGYDAKLLHVVDTVSGSSKPACILQDKQGLRSIVIKADQYQSEKYLFANRYEKTFRYKVEKILKSSTSTIKHLKVSLA